MNNSEKAPHRSSGLLLTLVGVLPVLAALGPILPVLGSFYAFRVCVVIFAALCVLAPRVPSQSLVRNKFVLLAAVWAVMAALLMFRVTDMTGASTQVFSLLIGVLLILSLSTMADPERVLVTLTRGWLVSFLITGLVAGWEALSGRHLPNYYWGDPTQRLYDFNLPASVFGNPNNYAFFLVATFPLLIIGLTTSASRRLRVLFGVSASTLPILVFSTGSRVCMTAIAIQVFVVLLFLGKRYVVRSQGVLLLAAACVVAFVPVALRLRAQRGFSVSFTGGPAEWFTELIAGGPTSAGSRINLTMDGLWMTYSSWMLGVGPGNFQTVMKSGTAPYPAGYLIDPHNGFIEILAQYGVIVTVLLVLWLGSCLALGWRAARYPSLPRQDPLRITGLSLVLTICVLPLTSLSSSSFTGPSSTWMLLATLLVMAVVVERGLKGSKHDFKTQKHRASGVEQSPLSRGAV